MEWDKTSRGFKYGKFKDNKNIDCTIQESSNAESDCIWLGALDIGLKEFIAHRQPSAWEPIELEDTIEHHFIANNRMELTREMVEELIPILQNFVNTGRL